MDGEKWDDAPACFNCGNTSQNVALLRALINNVKQWVCVRCLPHLIHGPH
jgi:hypothetical protein